MVVPVGVGVGVDVCVPILGFDADAGADEDSGVVPVSVWELACIPVDSFAASGLTIWKDIVAMLIIECLDQ